jgi:hypothetical protein
MLADFGEAWCSWFVAGDPGHLCCLVTQPGGKKVTYIMMVAIQDMVIVL